MFRLDAIARRLRRCIRNDTGAAAVEFVLALPLIVSVATAANDFGQSLRASSALEAAVRDTARILSLTPIAPSGDLMGNGVTKAFEVFERRIQESGLTVTYAAPGLSGATCAAGGSPCYRLDAITGSEAVFGRTRYAVTVAASVTVSTPLLALLRPDVEVAGDGMVSMTTEISQLHFR